MGNVLKTRLSHSGPDGLQIIRERFEYDHDLRLKESYLMINNQAEIKQSPMTYNEIGELTEKNLHETTAAGIYLQSVDYEYNIRGWLQGINQSGNGNDNAGDLYSMQFHYEDGLSGLSAGAQHNGNISAIQWTTADNPDIIKGYGYSYDSLNLPTEIVFDNHHRITYLYDATGQKLKKQYYQEEHLMHTMDYSGIFEYRDNHIDHVLTTEGRLLRLEAGQYRADYFLKDHLGSVRICFSDESNNQRPELLQVNDYYPFGMTIPVLEYDNQLKYNGKELQTENELGWYDYGARFYDPQLGRFTCLDPLADKFVHLSPYNYADNSPIANIDLWGLQAWYAADGNLIAKPFSDEPVAGPLSESTIQEIGATEYGVLETKKDYSFTDQEIQDFADWNASNGSTESGDCIGAATTGSEMLTGADAGFRNSNGQNDFSSGGTVRADGRATIYDVGINLENAGNAVEIATQQGQETNSIVNNSNTAGTSNTAYVAGPAGAYHSIITTRNSGSNQFSIYDQGTGWDVKNKTQQGAQNSINSINGIHPNWGSRMWQLNKTQKVEVRYPVGN